MKKLNENFLYELFRLIILKKELFEVVRGFLKYQFLPSQEFKKIYKDIDNYYKINLSVPTFGVLYENNKQDQSVIDVLTDIKETQISDVDPVIKALEKYIKEVSFRELWEEVKELYKTNEESAILHMSKESTRISELSLIKKVSPFRMVFKDFQKVQLEKEIAREEGLINKRKVPSGILPIDVITHGGFDRKDTVLWIMRSGVGKSTSLKYTGLHACMLGFNVLHIQLEGSEEEAFDKYTQVWSALSYNKVRFADIDETTYKGLCNVVDEMILLNQDIAIKSYEQFDEATMRDVRDEVVEYNRIFGKFPDLLILDSIDLAHPGDGLKYGADIIGVKLKIQNSARKFKNICNEFNMVGITATQTGEVKFDVWNDPDKVITRSDSMGDKNIANSFSHVFTGNQTMDEEKNNTMRIFFDKIRFYSAKEKIYPIATNYGSGRFFNPRRTRTLFSDIYDKQ